MAFKKILSVTGADHSDRDVAIAARLCAEVGAYLSVLIISPPPLLMSPPVIGSPPPLGGGIAEWSRHRAHHIAAREFSQDMANLEKTLREIHKVLRATWRCYDVDTEHCDNAGVGDAVRQRALCTDLTIVGPARSGVLLARVGP